MRKVSGALLLFSMILVLSGARRAAITSNISPDPPRSSAEGLVSVPSPTTGGVSYPAKKIQRTCFHRMTPDPDRRAMWVWHCDIVKNKHARAAFLNFIERTRVDTIYLNARDLLPDRSGALEDFIGELGDVQVEWLEGNPSFARAGDLPEILDFVRKVVEFTRKVNRDGRSVTIHLDIEPYLLDEWTTDRGGIITQYLDGLTAVKKRLAREEGPPLRLGIDIPFWFDKIEATYNHQTKPLNQQVQDISDYVVIMDYRDTSGGRDGIISNASNELRYGLRIGKPVTVGVETKCIEPEKVTFCDEGVRVLNQVLSCAKCFLDKNPAFNGFAIEQYQAYRKLAERDLRP